MMMNGRSAANPHAANLPGIAVPEALPLPVTAIRVGSDIGRAAVIAVAGSVIVAGRVSIRIRTGRDRAADNGATDEPAGNGGSEGTLGMGGCRGRNGQGGDSGKRHQ